jgi:hypothetical protein
VHKRRDYVTRTEIEVFGKLLAVIEQLVDEADFDVRTAYAEAAALLADAEQGSDNV